MKRSTPLLTGIAVLFALAVSSTATAAVDGAAAKALMDSNKCGKCHALDKSKTGPALKKVAAKYRGKADGEENIIKTITTGRKVKMEDGTEEEHKIIKPQDPAGLKNLAQWILSQ